MCVVHTDRKEAPLSLVKGPPDEWAFWVFSPENACHF